MTFNYRLQEPERIRSLFDRLARRYDIGNDIVSFGTHRAIKRQVIELLAPRAGGAYVDLCCGTGDLAIGIWKAAGGNARVIGVDFSSGMLEVAGERASRAGAVLEFIEADVTKLPLRDAMFDGATMGFGLRNVEDKPRAFREAFRILKPGGRFLVLEFNNPRDSKMPSLYRAYLSLFVPLGGLLASGDIDAYQYLTKSIHTFPRVEEVRRMGEQAGFFVEVTTFVAGQIGLYNCLKP